MNPTATLPPVLCMSAEEWERLTDILGVMSFADGRLFEQEVTAYWDALLIFCKEIDADANYSRDQVGLWVAANSARLCAEVRRDDWQVSFAHRLHALSGSPFARGIFRALERISVSDHIVQEREFDALILASAYLGAMPSRRVMQTRR